MKLLSASLALFVLLNVLYLDWQVLIAGKDKQNASVVSETATTLAPSPVPQNTCSQGCLTAINQATVAAQLAAPAVVNQPAAVAALAVKEYFIPFGAGSMAAINGWQNVPGLSAYVNSASYTNVSQILFEVSVFVPTGNETVNVQLYNMTAQHPVWSSQVFFNGGTTGQLLISQPITLDPGNNLYQVQMQTQLNYPANIDQARLHIILK